MNRERFVRPRSYYIGALTLLLVGVIVGLGVSAGLNLQRQPLAQLQVATSPAALAAGSASSPFVSVVDRALPAVVFIETRKKVGGSDSEDPQDDFFRRFFNESPRRNQTRPSSGSGFIIDRDGRILTNNHVVKDAAEINVTLNDKRQFKARVIGADPETDVAVIKIEGDNLPVLPLGDSDRLRVGDWAIAMGNPLGELKGSVTVGIISAQGRSNLNIYGGTPTFQDFIQTDASINFGNSGGPLCNIRGEAIGINTAINTSGQGIGFAIPINLVRHVADQLVAHGEVKRAWMGVTLAELTPELADGFGIKNKQGVVIQDVLRGEPAEQAGLRRGDIIVELEGQPVVDLQKFRLKVADTPVGTHLHMTVLRGGSRVPVDVTLKPRRTDLASFQGGGPGPAKGGDTETPAIERLAGIHVRGMSESERKNGDIETGVWVTDVQEGSAAEEAGLQANDIIEEAGGKPVNTPAELAQAITAAEKSGKAHVVLLVRRGDGSFFVPVKIAK